MLPANLKKEILNRLKPLDLDKIILFGSYAYGTPTDDSDVDLYVITKDDYIPENWNAKKELYLKVSRQIRDLRKHVPIDLIVHTKKMHEKFIALNSSFSRDICKNGINLL